jgi:hypothetical protein
MKLLKTFLGIVLATATAVSGWVNYLPGTEYKYSFESNTRVNGDVDVSGNNNREFELGGIARVSAIERVKGGVLMELTLSEVIFKEAAIRNPSEYESWFNDKKAEFVIEHGGRIGVVSVPRDTRMGFIFKGVMSALQTLVPGEISARGDVVDVEDAMGVHAVRVRRNGDHTIFTEFDQTGFKRYADERVDRVLVRGNSTHVKHHKMGIHQHIEVHHHVRIDTESLVESSGGIVLKFISAARFRDENHSLRLEREVVYKESLMISPREDEGDESLTASILKQALENPSDLMLLHRAQERFSEFPSHVKVIDHIWAHAAQREILGYLLQTVDSREARKIMIKRGVQNMDPEQNLLERSISPDFPYSKSKSFSATVGPSDLNLNFNAQYFVGTDFNACHGGTAQDLNYKIGASATATAKVFGYSKTVIDLEAWYVAMAGATQENDYSAKVFGNTLASGTLFPFQTGACKPLSTKSIWSGNKGFNVGYEVVVVMIPVKFSVGLTTQLSLSYGYQFCPQDLKAMVEITPSVSMIASASATADAVVVKGGIEISGSVNRQLQPSAWINFNDCDVGVRLDLLGNPASVKFDGFYQTRTCSVHHWKLTCGWGSKHEHVFWAWSGSATQQLLWGEDCQYNLNASPRLSCHQMN